MEKLELKYILPYWEHQVRVQYEGVINGKEIAKYNKGYNEDIDCRVIDMIDDPDYKPPKEILGLKVGYIKEIAVYKTHQNFKVGVMNYGLKQYGSFMPNFKLILHPMSDLMKSTWINKLYIEFGGGYGSISSYKKYNLNNILYSSYKSLPYDMINMLCEMHFNVFNLHENLWVNINTLGK